MIAIFERDYNKQDYNQTKDINEYRVKRKQYSKRYREKNKVKLHEKFKKYYLDNKEKIKIRRNKYLKQRRKNSINFRLEQNYRRRVREVLQKNIKQDKFINLLGCTIEEFKIHLKKQFKFDMNWNNYGQWHIDHVRPCASFDFSKSSNQYECFNYKNLQPLWAEENLRKSDFYDAKV